MELMNEAMETEIVEKEALPEEELTESLTEEPEAKTAEPEEAESPEPKKNVHRDYEADRIAASARRAMERAARENDDFARQMGYASFDEFKKAGLEARKAAIQKQIEDGDLSAVEPLIEQKLGSMPEVEAMRELQERENARMQEEIIERDIRELMEHFPDAGVKTKEDLLALPNAGEILHAAQAGIPLYRAYAAYSVDSIAQRKADAAKRAALNAQSKDHLKRTGGTGAKAGGPIPKETLDFYHALNPKVSDKEIMEHWRRNGGK